MNIAILSFIKQIFRMLHMGDTQCESYNLPEQVRLILQARNAWLSLCL